MVKETRYGVISDVHRDPRIVGLTIDVLKKLGAEKLIVNGDIGERQRTLQASQDYVAVILDAVGKSGLESYVQPGSHETIGAFQPVLEHFKRQYSNLMSTFDVPKVDNGDHHLVFLPGSDFVCGGEYQIGSDENIPSGLYLPIEQGLVPYNPDAHRALMAQGKFRGLLHYANMNDLKKTISDGGKTIAVCHVPRKFDSLEGAVDGAYFGVQADGSVIPGIVIEDRIRRQYGAVSDMDVRLIAAANRLTLKRENRGNQELRKLYAELGVTKAVSGHFHESGHKAHDANVKPVQQGTLVDELYWNSGQLDLGQTGILMVRDGRVSYQNVKLQDYLK
ncbi:metallophosphoesterase [Candidatus Woesearchaeota archaeon]|nr:metallophosphoesterase [Candidatus Woesearchaeota archaeon]